MKNLSLNCKIPPCGLHVGGLGARFLRFSALFYAVSFYNLFKIEMGKEKIGNKVLSLMYVFKNLIKFISKS